MSVHPIGRRTDQRGASVSMTADGAATQTDPAWLDHLRGGDADAFDELARRFRTRIVRHGRRYLREPADAEDLAQDVLVKVWTHVAGFEGSELLWPWIARITSNAAISTLRARQRETRGRADEVLVRDDGSTCVPMDPIDPGVWADQEISLTQFRAQARAALRRLPSSYRGAVRLLDFEDCSTREASALLGVPVPTVKSRAIRGRRLLRQALGPFGRGLALRP